MSTATAPFSDAVNSMFGGTWAGKVMAIAVIVSGFGALNGWTMICAEMPLAAAKDGLFPEQFKRISPNGVPAFGIVASTVLASIAMAINYLGSSGATAFTTLVLMSGITAAIPYGFSALAQMKWRMVDHRTLETPRFVRDMVVAVVSLVFSSCSSSTRATPGTASGSTGRRSSSPARRCSSASRCTRHSDGR